MSRYVVTREVKVTIEAPNERAAEAVADERLKNVEGLSYPLVGGHDVTLHGGDRVRLDKLAEELDASVARLETTIGIYNMKIFGRNYRGVAIITKEAASFLRRVYEGAK